MFHYQKHWFRVPKYDILFTFAFNDFTYALINVNFFEARGKQGGGYTKEELLVLRKTSTINGREYLPFLDSYDIHELFAFAQPFTYVKVMTICADCSLFRHICLSIVIDFYMH